MHWGHEVAGREGPQPVTRGELNAYLNVDTPDQPPIPMAAAHVWDWWWELNARRSPGFESLCPMTYSELKDWAFMTGKKPDPVESKWIMEMDDAWLDEIAKESKAKRERDQQKAANKAGK